MSLRARLRISIVAFVAFVVMALSALYLDDFTEQAFQAAAMRAELVANQVNGYVLERLEQRRAALRSPPANLAELKRFWREVIRTDPNITAMLRRTMAPSDVVIAIRITGEDGTTLVGTNPFESGSPRRHSQSFQALQGNNTLRNLWSLYRQPEDYTTTVPLGVEQQTQPIFNITVVIGSSLLAHALRPAFRELGVAFAVSLLVTMVLASVLPNLVLGPLERVRKRIDLLRAGQFEAPPADQGEAREFADVQSQLGLLGEQYRGARQDAQSLRANVDEMLQRLEEAVLFFDPAGRLMMAGRPVERLLGRPPGDLIGRGLEEIFPRATAIGALVLKAVSLRQSLRDEVVALGTAHILLNVEILRKTPDGGELGTLITLRDSESRRQLERQLDVSSRLAAISRLTGGVAHEIKNPLNAMALHLEVLRDKLDGPQPEIDVIAKEIKRLDQVVKTFLSFNKPFDVRARPVDLASLAREAADLIGVEARQKGIRIEMQLADQAWINGDRELLTQAILNVVVNGLEAMKDRGRLELRVDRTAGECSVKITDEGPGIPPELREKIFNLYFSTKKNGSGIGLATTFRVVHLHGGTIDLASEMGKGSSFRLGFPEWSAAEAGPSVGAGQVTR